MADDEVAAAEHELHEHRVEGSAPSLDDITTKVVQYKEHYTVTIQVPNDGRWDGIDYISAPAGSTGHDDMVMVRLHRALVTEEVPSGE